MDYCTMSNFITLMQGECGPQNCKFCKIWDHRRFWIIQSMIHLSHLGIQSGVVQDIGIGLIMFIVFINDLIDVLEHYGVTCKLFADYLKLCSRVSNPCDIVNLQLALDALADWEKCWQLSVSPSKCCVMCISAGNDSRVGNSPCLHISDTQFACCKFHPGPWYYNSK